MLDIADGLHRWCREGRDFAVATVTAVSGSAPRQPGAALAVDASGAALGSVSGGCVEGAVYELCRTALETGEPVTVPAAVPGRAVVAAALEAAAAGGAAALARVVRGPRGMLGRALLVRPGGAAEGTLGGPPELDRAAAAVARALLEAGRTAAVGTGTEGGRCGEPVTLLVETAVPPPRMLVFGAVDFASALVRAGVFLGHRVTVCDARPVFATPARFPEADEVVADWPHRYLDSQRPDARTAICVLTHDPRFDVPLLERALRLPVAYVGAMGSRRTHADRLARLREAGLTDAELARLRSPIGLDLGARTPEETALSIAAEIVAVRRGGSGLPLAATDTPIHHGGHGVHGVHHGGDRRRTAPARPSGAR
jgi:xanthine dehydrogenase accessory factor